MSRLVHEVEIGVVRVPATAAVAGAGREELEAAVRAEIVRRLADAPLPRGRTVRAGVVVPVGRPGAGPAEVAAAVAAGVAAALGGRGTGHA
jgi:hypothetical protein